MLQYFFTRPMNRLENERFFYKLYPSIYSFQEDIFRLDTGATGGLGVI